MVRQNSSIHPLSFQTLLTFTTVNGPQIEIADQQEPLLAHQYDDHSVTRLETGLLDPPDEPLQGVDAPAFLPSTQVVMEKMRHDTLMQLSSKSEQNSIRRKPLAPAAQLSVAGARDSQKNDLLRQTSQCTTDPAIRFALDQLTIDEDLRGTTVYTTSPQTTVSAPAHLTAAPIYKRPTSNMSRHLYDSAVSRSSLQYPSGPPPQISTATAIHYIPATVLSPTRPAPTLSLGDPRQSMISTNYYQNQPDILLPYEQSTPRLQFLPAILRPVFLALYLVLCVLMLAALIFSGILSGLRTGLYDYTQFGGSRYFVFQYLPTLCGVFLLLWLFQIQVALQRVAPFIGMASPNSRSRSESLHLEMQATNFILPKVFYFRAGQPVLGICMVIFWLQIFTVPLLACVYNVYFYGNVETGHWRWITVQPIVWTLVGLFFLQVLAIILLLVWLFHRRTGLKWDPRSLADLNALLDRSNIMDDYADSEIFKSPNEFRKQLKDRADRIGFWHTTRQPTDVFYGIGEEGAPTRQYSLEQGRIRSRSQNVYVQTKGLLSSSLSSEAEYQHIRRRYIPWYLRIFSVLVLCALAIGLFVAFLVVSFVNHAVLRGFSPLTRVAPNADGFSTTNFLYSFIPALIGQILFLCWLSVDYAFRRLQPYANMSGYGGGTADRTILLDYPARLPLSVTASAFMGGDLRVAWFSLLSLVAATIPILAGGCFWAQFYIPQQQVRVAVDPSAYYALCVFLALYAFSLPLVAFGLRHRSLPHASTTLAEQISWLYQSRLLSEQYPSNSPLGTRGEMIARLITSDEACEKRGPHNSGDMGKFAFGRFIGRDRQYHLGIERLQPGDSRYMIEHHQDNQNLRDSGIDTEAPPAAMMARPVAPYPPNAAFTNCRSYNDTLARS